MPAEVRHDSGPLLSAGGIAAGAQSNSSLPMALPVALLRAWERSHGRLDANGSLLLPPGHPGPPGAPAVLHPGAPGAPGAAGSAGTVGSQPPWRYLIDRMLDRTSEPAVTSPPDDCYPYSDIVEFLHQYYVPVMIAMGLIGNLLSCVVFLNTHLRLRSSSYYLAALASADFGYLAVLVLVWLNSMHGIQVFNTEGWCQVVTYVSSVCGFLSVWLIVAFTVERFIAVQYPLHRPHMCTVARAKAIVGCIAGFAVIAHVYTLKTRGVVLGQDGYEVCEMLYQHRDVMRVINLVDAIVTLVVPIILIIVMNTMITRNLMLFGRRFKEGSASGGALATTGTSSWADGHMGRETASSSSSASGHRRSTSHLTFGTKASKVGKTGQRSTTAPPTLETNTEAPPLYCPPRSSLARTTQQAQPLQMTSAGRTLVSTRTQQSITKMLLLISSVFIVLNLPSHVMRVYASIAMFTGSTAMEKTESPAMWFGQQVAMLLYYTNFSINFLLYSMCGITFRRCLWQLVRSAGRHMGFCTCRGSARWSDCQFSGGRARGGKAQAQRSRRKSQCRLTDSSSRSSDGPAHSSSRTFTDDQGNSPWHPTPAEFPSSEGLGLGCLPACEKCKQRTGMAADRNEKAEA